MSMEEKIKEIMEFLVKELGINPFDQREILLLARSIEYADTSLYSIEPKNQDQVICNEIFMCKAKCYFKRKRVELSQEHQTAKAIQEYEYREVLMLKAKLSPIIYDNKHPDHKEIRGLEPDF